MTASRTMYRSMGFERAPAFDLFPWPDFVVEAYRLEILGPAGGARAPG
jgi:hypothetical protein